MKIFMFLLSLTLMSTSALANTLVGKTESGRTCKLENGDYYMSFSVEKGPIYALRKRTDMSFVETDLMSEGGGYYREPIGAIITFFGIGVKPVTLNLVSDDSGPVSYHVEVKGLFNDIQCNDLK